MMQGTILLQALPGQDMGMDQLEELSAGGVIQIWVRAACSPLLPSCWGLLPKSKAQPGQVGHLVPGVQSRAGPRSCLKGLFYGTQQSWQRLLIHLPRFHCAL